MNKENHIWQPIEKFVANEPLAPSVAQFISYKASMTEQLKHLNPSIKMRLLDEAKYPFNDLTANEHELHSLKRCNEYWIRHIVFELDSACLLLAKTIIPVVENNTNSETLMQLGSKPIGPAIFSNTTTTTIRHNIEATWLLPTHPYLRLLNKQLPAELEKAIGRRSTIDYQNITFVVNEVFTPELLEWVASE